MMNKMAEVKEMNLVGTIYDYNEKFVWIETKEDIYVVKAEMVTEIVEAAAITEAGFTWDGFVDGDGEFSYVIEGFTYDVMVNIDFNYGTFSMDTCHKGIEKEETEWHNAKQFKKMNTLIRNVIKWAEK